MSNRDLEVALFAGPELDSRDNPPTCAPGSRRRFPGSIDFGREFRRHYAAFRDRVRRFDQPGVAVVAIDRVARRLAGIACLAGRIGEPNALIAGRHREADLRLSGDATISLRQFALVVEPLTELGRPGRGVTYRVIDLRSRQGFRTEEDHTLGGVRADGPAFLAAGNYAFFFFVTGDPTDWPRAAAQAWSFIPERVYLEERERWARGSARRRAVGRAVPLSRPITLIQETGPASRLAAHSLVARGEARVAELLVTSAGGSRCIPIGPTALEDGVLIGRSDRCESSELLRDSNLSRVHLLIIEIAGVPYALDTASRNGSFIDAGPAFGLCALDSARTLHLADAARVMWRTTS